MASPAKLADGEGGQSARCCRASSPQRDRCETNRTHIGLVVSFIAARSPILAIIMGSPGVECRDAAVEALLMLRRMGAVEKDTVRSFSWHFAVCHRDPQP
jgi:hypothetical protein